MFRTLCLISKHAKKQGFQHCCVAITGGSSKNSKSCVVTTNCLRTFSYSTSLRHCTEVVSTVGQTEQCWTLQNHTNSLIFYRGTDRCITSAPEADIPFRRTVSPHNHCHRIKTLWVKIWHHGLDWKRSLEQDIGANIFRMTDRTRHVHGNTPIITRHWHNKVHQNSEK